MPPVAMSSLPLHRVTLASDGPVSSCGGAARAKDGGTRPSASAGDLAVTTKRVLYSAATTNRSRCQCVSALGCGWEGRREAVLPDCGRTAAHSQWSAPLSLPLPRASRHEIRCWRLLALCFLLAGAARIHHCTRRVPVHVVSSLLCRATPRFMVPTRWELRGFTTALGLSLCVWCPEVVEFGVWRLLFRTSGSGGFSPSH